MSKIEKIVPFVPLGAPAWVAEVAERFPENFVDALSRSARYPKKGGMVATAVDAARDVALWQSWSPELQKYIGYGSNCAETYSKGNVAKQRIRVAIRNCLPKDYVDAPFLDGYRLLERGRYLLYHIADSVCCCGAAKIPTVSEKGICVPAIVSTDKGVASMSGLVRCKNSWVCPVCAIRSASKRAAALACAVPIGYKARMITLTAPSSPLDYAAMSKLFKSVKSSTAKLLSSRSNFGKKAKEHSIMWAKSFDETFCFSSGFHPHLHIALFFSEDCERLSLDIAENLVEDWIGLLTSCGYPPSINGQHIGNTSYSVIETATYVFKSSDLNSTIKNTKIKDRNLHIGVFELMNIAAKLKYDHKNNIAADVFQNFARIVKGCRRFSYCRALKLDLSSNSDSALKDRVIHLGDDTADFLARNGHVPDLLSIVAAYDDPEERRTQASHFLNVLGVEDYTILPYRDRFAPPDYGCDGAVIVAYRRRRPSMLPDVLDDWDMHELDLLFEAGLLAA